MTAYLPAAVWGSVSDVIASAASLGLAAAAGGSAVMAVKTYTASAKAKANELENSNQAQAKEIWSNYLRLCLEHAYLTYRGWSALEEKARESGDSLDIEKYEWLTAIMFFAAEEILAIDEQERWVETIKNQIRFYYDYVYGFGRPYNATYSPQIRQLIDSVEREPEADRQYLRWNPNA